MAWRLLLLLRIAWPQARCNEVGFGTTVLPCVMALLVKASLRAFVTLRTNEALGFTAAGELGGFKTRQCDDARGVMA